MKIVIAGSSGFLGRPLARALAADGHSVVGLPRGSTEGIDGADAVVNLAGESIAGRRWNRAHKERILDSRIGSTKLLADAIRRASRPPRVFVSQSAVGYYGPHGDEIVDEDAAPGADFMARVCAEWEAEAMRVVDRTRVACPRTGLVLERDGGALPQMLPPFKFGVGGPLGSGGQYWPWIHRADWIALVRWAIATPQLEGPFNATAPEPVTNRAFAAALGRVLHRPVFVPAPAFALDLIVGEMAGSLLLSGQRAVPAKAQRLGFTFTYPTLDAALRAIFGNRQ